MSLDIPVVLMVSSGLTFGTSVYTMVISSYKSKRKVTDAAYATIAALLVQMIVLFVLIMKILAEPY